MQPISTPANKALTKPSMTAVLVSRLTPRPRSRAGRARAAVGRSPGAIPRRCRGRWHLPHCGAAPCSDRGPSGRTSPDVSVTGGTPSQIRPLAWPDADRAHGQLALQRLPPGGPLRKLEGGGELRSRHCVPDTGSGQRRDRRQRHRGLAVGGPGGRHRLVSPLELTLELGEPLHQTLLRVQQRQLRRDHARGFLNVLTAPWIRIATSGVRFRCPLRIWPR